MTILRTLGASALVVVASGLISAGPGLAAPIENCLPRRTTEERTAVLTGTTADNADWIAAFGVDNRGIQLVCVGITFDGAQATRGVLGGPFEAARDDDEIIVSVLSAGFRGGQRWHVVRGTVTACADRVELSIDGARPVAAQIADTGPEAGWHWYAMVVPAGEAPGIPSVTAVAYDADNEVIADGESPF